MHPNVRCFSEVVASKVALPKCAPCRNRRVVCDWGRLIPAHMAPIKVAIRQAQLAKNVTGDGAEASNDDADDTQSTIEGGDHDTAEAHHDIEGIIGECEDFEIVRAVEAYGPFGEDGIEVVGSIKVHEPDAVVGEADEVVEEVIEVGEEVEVVGVASDVKVEEVEEVEGDVDEALRRHTLIAIGATRHARELNHARMIELSAAYFDAIREMRQ